MSVGPNDSESRILTQAQQVEEALAAWRQRNPRGRLVFTNGCFDILHSGHVAYLEEARKQGDALLLGLNSDASVRRLKGSERPINNEQARARVLAGLRAVDFVVIFEQDTPIDLIRRVRPDVLVKGGDWEKTAIVGWDFVEGYGGEVKSLLFVDGYSTTSTIAKIRSRV